MKLGDIQVTIQVDDTALDEYDIVGTERRATCYIASEAGKNFKIAVRNDTDTEFVFEVHCDGVSAESYSIKKHQLSTKSGARVDRGTTRDFMFGVLHLTDDDNAGIPSQSKLEELGTLRVDFFRCIYRGEAPWQPQIALDHRDLDELSTIHEKAKKAGSHKIRLGDQVPANNSMGAQVKYIDQRSDDPYIRFLFRYRPRDVLQAQGLIPHEENQNEADDHQLNENGKRPSVGAAGPSRVAQRRRDNEGGSDGDPKNEEEGGHLDALLAQRAALDQQIRRAEAQRRVKREASPIVLKAAVRGEVIDLTSD